MRVALTTEAREELHEAAAWYAERSQIVAQRFVAAYKLARSQLAEAPERWAEIEPGVRRVQLHKFPYSILYAIEEHHVLVLALKHHKRRPAYWHNR